MIIGANIQHFSYKVCMFLCLIDNKMTQFEDALPRL